MPLDQVTEAFEAIYQGTGDTEGLKMTERLIPAMGVLTELAARCQGRVAIVTGRPRSDCIEFLRRFGLDRIVSPDRCVCMGEAASKPSPEPVLKAMQALVCESASSSHGG